MFRVLRAETDKLDANGRTNLERVRDDEVDAVAVVANKQLKRSRRVVPVTMLCECLVDQRMETVLDGYDGGIGSTAFLWFVIRDVSTKRTCSPLGIWSEKKVGDVIAFFPPQKWIALKFNGIE